MPFDNDLLIYIGWVLLYLLMGLITLGLFIALFFQKDRARAIVFDLVLVSATIFMAVTYSANFLTLPKLLQTKNPILNQARAHNADLATLGLFSSYCFDQLGPPWKQLGLAQGSSSYERELKRVEKFIKPQFEKYPDDAKLAIRFAILEKSLKADPNAVLDQFEEKSKEELPEPLDSLRKFYDGKYSPAELKQLAEEIDSFELPNGWYRDQLLSQICAGIGPKEQAAFEQKDKSAIENWKRYFCIIESVHASLLIVSLFALICYSRKLFAWLEPEPSTSGFREAYAVFLTFLTGVSIGAFGAGIFIGFMSVRAPGFSLLGLTAKNLIELCGYVVGFALAMAASYCLICRPQAISLWQLYRGNTAELRPYQWFLILLFGVMFALGIQIFAGFVVALVMTLVGSIMHTGAYEPKINPLQYEQLNSIAQSNLTGVLWAFIAACTLAPMLEELIFRRLIFTWLRYKWGVIPGIVISSILFSASHFDANNLVQYFMLGCVFCAFYARTRNLLLTVCLHAAYNFWALWSAILLMSKSG